MAQHADLCRDDVELFADDVADRCQQCAVVRAVALGLRQFMGHIEARQVVGQRLTTALLTGGFGDGGGNGGGALGHANVRGRIDLGLIEQTDLSSCILNAGGFTPQKPLKRATQRDPRKIKAWLKREYPRIALRAKREKAVIYWSHETGVNNQG